MPGAPRTVQTLQALFLLSIFHIFALREAGEHPSYNFSKLINTAKEWKLFDGDRISEHSNDWQTWIAAESKKRYHPPSLDPLSLNPAPGPLCQVQYYCCLLPLWVCCCFLVDNSLAFFMWIMDCGLVMYFGDRPSIPVYEIRHRIQCHEDIWCASTASEWLQMREKMPVNESEFPLLMSMLISPDIPVPPPNLSVLGNFCLLHGIPSPHPVTPHFWFPLLVSALWFGFPGFWKETDDRSAYSCLDTTAV